MKQVNILLLIAYTTCTYAQINKANEHFENYEYAEAIPIYEKNYNKKGDVLSAKRLAISYKNINNLEQAEEWYKTLLEKDDSSPKNKLELAKILIQNNKPSEARIYINAYKQLVPGDKIAEMLEEKLGRTEEFLVDSFFYRIESLPINSVESSFSPIYFEEGIIFTSQRPASGKNEVDTWTGNSCFNLYYAQKLDDGSFKEPELLKGEVKSPFHEGSAAYVEELNRMYFTRSNVKKMHLEKSDSNINNLQLYTAVLEDGEWNKVQKLSFNEANYSYGQPTLSKDGNTIYLVSDQPGGLGGTDIFTSSFDGYNWSKLKSLGNKINTFGKEMFPYLDDSGDTTRLYYSSDGRPGLGGLDIYYSDLIDGEWSTPLHMSYPINSNKDDFGIVIRKDDKAGFFSSNRQGENGNDQIFAFELVEQEFYLAGSVKDVKNSNPLENVVVKVMNRTLKNVYETTTDNNGEFLFKVEKNSDFIATADLKGYFSDSKNTTTMGMRRTDTVYVSLELDKLEVEKTIRLDNIYYDYDKWDIRSDAEQELNRLVATLLENPEVRIELSSHTDSRGSDSYNKKLSQKRAQSAVNYIVEHGIERKRMVAKGYGETRLLNKCDDGVECSEDQHQFNRRTEFKVIK